MTDHVSRQAYTKVSSGFTLIEVMISLLLSALIAAALYSAYLHQQQSQIAQDQVVEMLQHLRGGVNFMVRELRMAGLDPQTTSDAGIVAATSRSITFTRDLNDNGAGVTPGDGDTGDAGENISYGFAAGADLDNDGIVDPAFIPYVGATPGTASIDRTTADPPPNPGPMPIADHIEAIEFLYLVGDDRNPTLTPAAGQLDNIRAIVISILARAELPDTKFINNTNYLPASNDPAFQNGAYNMNSGVTWAVNDNFRRNLLITTINLRNMGL